MGVEALSERIGTNSGHGHVWPRPDGVKMRCGGPAMCRECGADAAIVAAAKGHQLAPISGPDSHPIIVNHGKNPIMDCWEVQVVVGNFKSDAAAIDAANRLVALMQQEFGAGPNVLQ